MKIYRRIISIIVCFIFIINTMGITSIAVTRQQIYAGNQLKSLNVLVGYEDGTLRLDNNIIRAEIAALAVRILGYDETIIVGQEKKFSDVANYWAAEEIQNASKLGLIYGYPDGSFRPKNDISYAEVIAIMVNTLGKNKDLTGSWPDNYINKAKSLGIIPKDSQVNPGKKVTRGEVAVILWNTILAKK